MCRICIFFLVTHKSCTCGNHEQFVTGTVKHIFFSVFPLHFSVGAGPTLMIPGCFLLDPLRIDTGVVVLTRATGFLDMWRCEDRGGLHGGGAVMPQEMGDWPIILPVSSKSIISFGIFWLYISYCVLTIPKYPKTCNDNTKFYCTSGIFQFISAMRWSWMVRPKDFPVGETTSDWHI
jgi:hypothetical protein